VDISPGKISITAAGEKPRLHHIHTGEIKAVAHIAGLGKGKHRLKPEIILPFGLKLIQSYPEHVTVKLDRDLPDTANGTAEKGLAGR
jgi:YbbR domain-containing protein